MAAAYVVSISTPCLSQPKAPQPDNPWRLTYQSTCSAADSYSLSPATLELRRRDYAEAIPFLQAQGDAGSACAYLMLAGAYADAQGVPVDAKSYFFWMRKAAQKGSPDAAFQLFHLYFDGIGVEKNESKGLYWIRMAASEGESHGVMVMSRLSQNRRAAIEALAPDDDAPSSSSAAEAPDSGSASRARRAIEAKARLEDNNNPARPGHYSALLAIWDSKDDSQTEVKNMFGGAGNNPLAKVLSDMTAGMATHVVDIKYVNGYSHSDEYIVIAEITTSFDGKLMGEALKASGTTSPIAHREKFVFVRSEQGWIIRE